MNAAIAYDFFVGKGLADYQAAAVVGNLEQESRLDPRVPAGDGGVALGIAQWHPQRWKQLLRFANGREWELETQLAFVWYELETNPAAGLRELRESSTLEDAVVAFQDHFERCGVCATEKRIMYARGALLGCPTMRVPRRKKTSVVGIALGMIGVIAGAGYGAYRTVRSVRR